MKRLARVMLACSPPRRSCRCARGEPAKTHVPRRDRARARQNPDIAVAKEAVAGADAHVAGQKAHRWVALNVNSAVQPLARAVRARVRRPRRVHAARAGHDLDDGRGQPAADRPRVSLRARRRGRARRERGARRLRSHAARHRVPHRRRVLRVLEARASADVAHQSVDDIAERARSREQAARGRHVHRHRRAAVQVGEGRGGSNRAARRYRRRRPRSRRSSSSSACPTARRSTSPTICRRTPPRARDDARASASARDDGASRAARRARADRRRRRTRASPRSETYLPDVRAVAAWHPHHRRPAVPARGRGVRRPDRCRGTCGTGARPTTPCVEAEHAQNRARRSTANATRRSGQARGPQSAGSTRRPQFDSLARRAARSSRPPRKRIACRRCKLDNAARDDDRRARCRDRCRACTARRSRPRATTTTSRSSRSLARSAICPTRSRCSSRTSSPIDHAWNGQPTRRCGMSPS